MIVLATRGPRGGWQLDKKKKKNEDGEASVCQTLRELAPVWTISMADHRL